MLQILKVSVFAIALGLSSAAFATGGGHGGGDSGGGDNGGDGGGEGPSVGASGGPAGGEGGVGCDHYNAMPTGQAGCTMRPTKNLKDLIEALGR